MTLTFYPHTDEVTRGTLKEKIEVMMEAAERYRIAIQDIAAKETGTTKIMSPKDLQASYNWEQVALILHRVRDLPESSKEEREIKADLLTKLSEVYEVLRSAKMSKLEAVRLALIGEAKQLQGGV